MWIKFLQNFRNKPRPPAAALPLPLPLPLLLPLLLLPLQPAFACGISYVGEDYRVALLNPYVCGDSHWQFFYTANQLNGTTNNRHGSDRDRNCDEWAAYLGGNVAATDVRAFLYPTSLDDVLNAVAEGADNQQFATNTFFQALLRQEHRPVLEYLVFSKKYEHWSGQHQRDPWGSNRWDHESEAEVQAQAQAGQQLKAQALALLPTLQDPWLRRRYAYQLMLMHRYDGEREAFQKIYDQHFADNRSTVLADWALIHLADLTTDPALANYRYALVFDRCPEKQLAALQRFDKKHLDATLALAQNDHERAVILAIFETKNPGRSLANLRRIHALDPANQFLPLLLGREVGKLEDWLLTGPVTGMGTANYPNDDSEEKWEWDKQQWENYRQLNLQKDRAYLAEVRAFFEKTTAANPRSDLLQLLTAHLFLLEKNATQASRHLAAIGPHCGPEIAGQRALEELLILLNGADLHAPKVQADLARHLAVLQKRQDSYPQGRRDFQALNLVLADAFLQKNDLVTAFFCELNAPDFPTEENTGYGTSYYRLIRFLDWRATEQHLDQVLALIEKREKTAFERYLCSATLPSRNALLDLRGTVSFRKNDLPEALAAFSQVEPGFWKNKYEFGRYLDSDPFAIFADSTHRGTFPPTKAAFVQRLLDLESEARTNPAKAAENYLLLGRAWLNCSYRGNSWMMFSYGQYADEMDVERWFPITHCPRPQEMMDMYYHQKRALDYFSKARTTQPADPELLAQLGYLQARMEWWHYDLGPAEIETLDQLPWDERGRFLAVQELSLYKKWVANYEGTGFWQEVRGACPVLMTYFGK